jgi:hypothetical protein
MSDQVFNPRELDRVNHLRAMLSEIRMLVDYVAASSTRTLDDLKIHDPGSAPPAELNSGQLLLRLDEVEARAAEQAYNPSDLALIQIARDALGRLIRPASGLTVAYTAMVVGNRRGKRSESRATFAQQAYPGFRSGATVHRWAQRALLVIAVLVTLTAVWESAKVALGKSLLQNLASLRVEQSKIAEEKAQLETTLDRLPEGGLTPDTATNNGHITLAAFGLCDRSKALAYYLGGGVMPTDDDERHTPLSLSSSPLVRQVCGRDTVLAVNLGIAHADLRQYRTYWPGMVGSVFNLVGQVASVPCDLWGCRAIPQVVLAKGQDDVEFVVTPMLLVWGNYILPVIFGFLGAAIFVILDFFGKIRESRLDPRDNFLSWIRLVLGLVTGSAVGLFFSAYGPPPSMTGAAADLTGSLTLSASGVAFLAGFGVEGVFTMLESLVGRVFASQENTGPSRPL